MWKFIRLLLIAVSIFTLSSCSYLTNDSSTEPQAIAEQALLKYQTNGPIETYSWLQSKVDDNSITEDDYDYIIAKLQERQ